MSVQANYFKLGLFMIVAIALILAGVAVLGAGALLEKPILVETYFIESVQGLTAGAPVKYRGVQVGQVHAIQLAAARYEPDFPKQQNELGLGIVVDISLDKEIFGVFSPTELTQWFERVTTPSSAAPGRSTGLRVQMASSGITGPPYLAMSFLDAKEFPPAEISWTPRSAYVPSAPSTMHQIVAGIQKLLRELDSVDVGGIGEELSRLLASADKTVNDVDTKVNDLDTKKISDEAVALLEEVRRSNDRLKAILDDPDVDATLEDVAATAHSLREVVGGGEGDLETFVADLPEISARLKDATARLDEILSEPQVQQIIDSIDRVSGDLPPAITDVRRTVRRIDRLIAGQEQAIEAAIQELRRALENIDEITEDAKQNPSRVLFGDPPPKDTPGEDR